MSAPPQYHGIQKLARQNKTYTASLLKLFYQKGLCPAIIEGTPHHFYDGPQAREKQHSSKDGPRSLSPTLFGYQKQNLNVNTLETKLEC